MTLTAYVNARLMDPLSGRDETGALLVNGPEIAALGADAGIPENAARVDCRGKVLAPGFIDMRAHRVEWEAAAAGGITTIVLQPDQTTIIDADAAVERIRSRAAARSTIRVYPMGAATKGLKGREIAEIGQMQASGAVAFTDCRQPVADARVMRRLLEYASFFDALVVQFPQEPSLAEGGSVHEGEIATRLGLAGIPVAAEVIQIERDARLALLTGARLHFALVSSREGLEAVRRARAAGARVTCSVAPHYLHLNANAVEGFKTFARVSPPLREESDRRALIAGLADGTIDTLVSDHDPQSEDSKRLPFEQAAFGVLSFETMLPLALGAVHAGHLDLMRLLDSLTAAPARLLGLPGGHLAPGAPADLVLFDPDKPWRVDRFNMRAGTRNTPFDTLPVQGRVLRTVVNGATVFDAAATTPRQGKA
ncbi:dihydroorotase [Yunchengibacter salinarum]|uniref:dihydroorotase n=1 Tax=Yunchengibacter salinarum TaxID=3133399 RepID=UPI0035B67984